MQHVQRFVPFAARLVRVDGGGVHQLAGGIDHGDLAAGADARVQPQHHARAGRRGQQQVLEVVAEHVDGLRLGLFARLVEQVQHQVQLQLGAPGQARGIEQPRIARTALVGDAGTFCDAAFGDGVACVHVTARFEVELQEFLATAAVQGQQAMRGNLRQRLGMVEVVAVFLAGRFLAFHHFGADHADFAQPLTQLADQLGILAPALHQDGARALQRGLGVGHALVGINEGGGAFFRQQRRVGQQAVGQRLQPGLARDLRAGAALGLVRQVQVFEARLAVGRDDLGAQFVAQLALLVDAGKDGRAALFHLAQVAQARFQIAQLGVVQPAGDFLAVARDERHRRAFVEQRDGGAHLRRGGADLGGDGLGDLARKRRGNLCHACDAGLELRNRRLWQPGAADPRR